MPAMKLIQIGIVGAGTMGDRSRSESISTPMEARNMGRAPWQLGQTMHRGTFERLPAGSTCFQEPEQPCEKSGNSQPTANFRSPLFS